MSNGDITSYIPPTTTPPETEPTTPPVTQPTPSVKLGDVTGEGEITVSDATLVQKHLAAIAKLTSQQMKAADVDNNGEVNIRDATEIQKYVAGISNALG